MSETRVLGRPPRRNEDPQLLFPRAVEDARPDIPLEFLKIALSPKR
jgi:hypothetical protein